MSYLRRRLREVGAREWPRIAAETGISLRLPAKIAYGERDNPTVRSVQPLLDYFRRLDRGEGSAVHAPTAPETAP